MCMLTAMVPTSTLSDSDIILGKLLFTSIILRNATSNRDGFGLAGTNKAHYKTAETAGQVIFSDPCIAAMTDALTAPLIGHVRTTSTGRTAKDGSHPFFVNSLAVAHNGTFSNYRGLLKENKDISTAINDPDPVDSHVFAHLLAKTKGKGNLKVTDIEATIKEMEGSYAVLVAERDQDFIWVIRGANTLYQAKVGPYRVVNTSKVHLENAALEVAGYLRLLFGTEFETSDVLPVPTYGVYKLSDGGLIKQAELPTPSVVVTTYDYTTGWQGRSYRQPAATSETAITRAALAAEITTIPGITYNELEITTDQLCGKSWYETKETDLGVVQQTLEVLSSRHYSPEKGLVWKEIVAVVGDSTYESVDNVLTLLGSPNEMFFPYFLHTVEELEHLLNLVRGGDNVIVS